MKKKGLVARIAAVALAVATIFTGSNLPSVKAANVADKTQIDLEIEGKYEEKQISKADSDVINKAFGYDSGTNNVIVCGDGSVGYIDWNESSIPFEKVCETYVFCPVLSRDESGNLQIEKDADGNIKAKNDSDGYMGWDGDTSTPAILNANSFSILSREASLARYADSYINENLSKPALDNVEPNDVYIIRVVYTTDDGPNYTDACLDYAGIYTNEDRLNRTFGCTDFWILPEGASSVLNFADETPEPEPSDETYTVDLGNSLTVSNDTFNAILAENATKDVVIKSNNDVTFTFAKGTMASVDGKTEYDFSTSIVNAYADTMPSYITKDNFVSQINFNYSGKLPAIANIRFYVGTQYAGQTLYYSLMNADNTFAEVQSVTVDAAGYMTVKQDHCSNYVVTNVKPKLASKDNTNTGDNTTADNNSGNGNVSNNGNTTVADSNASNGNTTVADNTSNGNTTNTDSSDLINKKDSLKPKKVASISAKRNGEKKATVKWKKMADVDGFQVIYSTKANFSTAKKINVSGKKNSCIISKLNKGKVYYVKVRAYKKNSEGKKVFGAYSKAIKIKK